LLPENPDALNGLGLVRLQHRRATEAAQFFARAVKQRPGYAPAMLNLAIVHQQYLKDPQAALQEYRAYSALKPPPPDAESVAAVARQLDEELNPPRATPVEPKTAHANGPLSPALSSRGGEGENALPASTPKPQTNTVARTIPAPKTAPPSNVVKVAPPAAPAAASKLETVSVSSEPVFKPAKDVSDTSADTGRTQAATTTSALQADETTQSAATPAGNRYKYISPAKPATGDRVAAERAMTQGTVAAEAHKLSDAERAFHTATKLDPAYFLARFNLASAAVQAGHLSVALGAYEHALAIDPDSADARYYFAMALKQANYPVDAAHELEKVVTRSPNEVRAHFALGNLYAGQLNQPAKARIHYQKVLDAEPGHPQASKILYWMNENPP
jgi:Tfp pilus assembly protein PilF